MSKSKHTDTDKLDFLECYVRHKLDLKAVCAELSLKYNTAAARLKTIQDGCAKRRGEAGDGAGGDANGGAKAATGGKKKAATATATAGKGAMKATKATKKRKIEAMDDDDDEGDMGVVKEEKGKGNGVKAEGEDDEVYHDLA